MLNNKIKKKSHFEKLTKAKKKSNKKNEHQIWKKKKNGGLNWEKKQI